MGTTGRKSDSTNTKKYNKCGKPCRNKKFKLQGMRDFRENVLVTMKNKFMEEALNMDDVRLEEKDQLNNLFGNKGVEVKIHRLAKIKKIKIE